MSENLNMINNDSKVSIVMCTYNGALYIKEQIDSILDQTYPIHELIIQDDGSQDDTVQIIKEYTAKYDFIHLYQNEKQKGINGNFYTAMQRATGDYIAIADQDDIWVSQKIEWQVQAIGDAWLSAGITKPFVEKSDIQAKAYFDNRKPNIYLERMMFSAMIAGHTMMMKREFLDKLFDLQEWMDYFMYDHFIQIVAGAYEKIAYVPKVLVNQRKHISSATYTVPFNYERSVKNIWDSVKRTFHQYKVIRPQMTQFFDHVHTLLKAIPAHNQSHSNGLLLSYYQSQNSLWNFIRLVFLCIRLRDRIFFSKEKNTWFAIARAIYFPISSSDYFRYFMHQQE